ncbi:uncharacterized protein BJ171DRAFT_601197 [Polychytrium aggregatum]|uniref:uncharacterized protein n=1 Tax=Polychytrium aggregatum TaxID=110093 RepID=UPI0022FEF9F3|nr:uncharacterized protein BJ171DRAFT_601197 [Polychytrium aggregatum]KAI9202043.1 hypothetical protein BJ171DRAFT_601197 [Polychytrium aggregatum]
MISARLDPLAIFLCLAPPIDDSRTTWIGIDPGVGSIFTAVIRAPGQPTIQEQDGVKVTKAQRANEKIVSFSNKEYQHRCGTTQATKWIQSTHKILGLQQWMSTTPSPKIPGVASFLRYIRHVFDGDMLEKQLYFSLTRRRRFKRLDLHSKRQRTVHEMCKQVIDQAPRETEVVIAFGNASWKQGKGYASSPRRLRFAKYFEQFHHHQRRPPDPSVSKIHVCSVNEFNTSQVCSHCREAKRLEAREKGPGSLLSVYILVMMALGHGWVLIVSSNTWLAGTQV